MVYKIYVNDKLYETNHNKNIYYYITEFMNKNNFNECILDDDYKFTKTNEGIIFNKISDKIKYTITDLLHYKYNINLKDLFEKLHHSKMMSIKLSDNLNDIYNVLNKYINNESNDIKEFETIFFNLNIDEYDFVLKDYELKIDINNEDIQKYINFLKFKKIYKGNNEVLYLSKYNISNLDENLNKIQDLKDEFENYKINELKDYNKLEYANYFTNFYKKNIKKNIFENYSNFNYLNYKNNIALILCYRDLCTFENFNLLYNNNYKYKYERENYKMNNEYNGDLSKKNKLSKFYVCDWKSINDLVDTYFILKYDNETFKSLSINDRLNEFINNHSNLNPNDCNNPIFYRDIDNLLNYMTYDDYIKLNKYNYIKLPNLFNNNGELSEKFKQLKYNLIHNLNTDDLINSLTFEEYKQLI
jgi:hypothetical protein